MKFLRLLCIILLPAISFAQKSASTKLNSVEIKKMMDSYFIENKSLWNLTDADISNWKISNLYSNKKTGITYLYIHQQVNSINIFNAVSSVSIKDGKVKSFAKRIHSDALSKINTDQPVNNAVFAIEKAAEHVGFKINSEPKLISKNKLSNRSYYSSPEISKDKIRVELVYQPVNKNLRLAWNVSIHLIDGSHWWNVRIDAVNGDVLQKNDWTTHCDFGDSETNTLHSHIQTPLNLSSQASSIPSYRVFALPVEAPNFGGTTLVTNPSDSVASPYGWHDTNGQAGEEYTITRGNNVFAYDDINDADTAGFSPSGTNTLTFDFPFNFSQQPVNYLDASITNLFYVNNMMHDLLYHYGFDEDAGNFQENNYGNGGSGNDYVIAQCQDGGGTNNANFSTPDDGENGVMQMYLWSTDVLSEIVVHSPSSIAGTYNAKPAGFGPDISSPITSELVLVNDGNGNTSDGCQTLINASSLAGKIAVFDRGSCTFVDKVLSAQNAGAIAVIVINNTAGLLAMSGNGNQGAVTIPSEMISQADGIILKNSLNNNDTVHATLHPNPGVDIDGSLDNGIVIHEYGHGVSNRLTGGPSNSDCLFNGEEGGEGWSDFFALMFTIQPNDSGAMARGIGTFANGDSTRGRGIRRFPYSTNMSINPETYGYLALSAEVHNIGEVWCSALWDLNWGLIDQLGFDADWKNGNAGNNIALQLVMEGLKLQPCGPGFLDARDAILQADENLYNGIHKCKIWEAFAKRGMGYHADQGDFDIAGDETEDFSMAPICLTPTTPPTANFIADNTNTCLGIVHFTDSSTGLAQSWRWNFGDGDSSISQNPTHTYATVGTYNVSLIVKNTLGSDTLLRTAYINYSRPFSTVISGDTIVCSGSSTVLTSTFTSGNEIEWRDENNSVISSGTIFNTPGIYNSTTFYSVQLSPTGIQHVGAVDSALGTGNFSTSQFDGRLIFTTFAPIRLKSVSVYSDQDTIRTIKLYGPGNVLLHSRTVFIPQGQSRVTLNFDIPYAGHYQIGVSSRSHLYRNTTGANFPYLLNGLVSITGSNSPQNSTTYYFLYNWEVQNLPCSSLPTPVNVSVNSDPVCNFNTTHTGPTVQFTNSSVGNIVSYQWNFGNGETSTEQNPIITYSIIGSYTVVLTVTSSNGCQSVSAKIITVTTLGVGEVELETINIYYSGQELVIKFQSSPSNARIKIYDPIGKLLLNTNFNNSKIFTTQLENTASEFILVNVNDNEQSYSKKIVLLH